MIKIDFPARTEWPALLSRPALDAQPLRQTVSRVLLDVKTKGDEAIRHYTQQFDGVALQALEINLPEPSVAAAAIDTDLRDALETAADNIRSFHHAQWTPPQKIETMPGVTCWRKSVPLERVGLYIPGGTAPLFSTVLMLGIPAQLAKCNEIILCTPPGKDGQIHPAIVYAAILAGVHRIFAVGGVQAIGAMAYGTQSIPAVDKIFGPGNQYVTCAKQMVQEEGLAIDMPAGPSEVCVLADHTVVPDFVAADLLSQAEHGVDSQVLLVAVEGAPVEAILQALDTQLAALPRASLAAKALENSRCIVVHTIEEGIELVNAYAAEHLILSIEDAERWAEKIQHAGSVFIGHFSPESVGDYASGTNHTLPTNGYARAYSGVSLDSFVKKITFQQLSRSGLTNIAGTVVAMARAEQLEAHARAVTIRQAYINQEKI
jgi:histidinol dehydrogenase